MHRSDTIARALDLAAQGRSASEISALIDCPRSTVRGWLSGAVPGRAQRTGDCRVCGGPTHDLEPIAPAYVYLLGLYLGDGCIATHPRAVHRLRIVLDSGYPDIVAECRAAMQAVVPRNRVATQARCGGFANSTPGSNVEVSAYSKCWPCLFPQHGPGRKHHRPIVLTDWQCRLVDRHPERLLRGLIHSDGCRFVNTGRNWRHPRYSFSNRSNDIRRIFCDACDRLALSWTEAPHTVYVSRVADVARLDEFVGPKR